MNYDLLKSYCPECGKEVFVTGKSDTAFCDKLCESNYKYRKKFRRSPQDQRISSEKARRL